MLSSMSGQDEPNPALQLATQEAKVELQCIMPTVDYIATHYV